MEISNPFYHQFETNKADWSVDYWLKLSWMRNLGLRSSDFNTHPQIDDIMILLQLRQALWDQMNLSEQATWGAYWGIVFKKKYPLTNKFWRKFQNIANNIDQRQARQQLQRQLIKQTRTIQNKDHNNDGKGSDLSRMLTDEGNHRGAAMSLQQ